jgi:predicted Zn finger-like uncharacterized protein
MSMLTRCPHCDTVFRVTAQQLQKQHGQVRCGRCMQVFDGFRTLSSASDRGYGEAAAEPERVESAAPAPAAEVPPRPRLAAEPARNAVPPTRSPATPSAPATEPAPIEDEEWDPRDGEGTNRSAWYWSMASMLLLVLLLAQALYVFRVEVAARYPALRPLYARVCAQAGCTVPLPQEPRLIAIEASDLQVPDPAQPGVIQLTATLRSHATYDVGYPALDLVLTNTQDHMLARRVFLPRDYLAKTVDPKSGIAPNAEVTLHLDLDTGNLGAAGFRLDLLPSPS